MCDGQHENAHTDTHYGLVKRPEMKLASSFNNSQRVAGAEVWDQGMLCREIQALWGFGLSLLFKERQVFRSYVMHLVQCSERIILDAGRRAE